ncbi:tetratricopeptide repeat protein [Treponema putidum]|uniref:Tetratricopeptide repeat protein n=1 Tax=Treponema putidum TaxID=221027 RepID=A0AAE9SI37_9SPIR|nr:tetratricopeptide repeat protein [Treponema putidum]UTY33690.1 tetratricopeptide repeat protein [Treponema putidum]
MKKLNIKQILCLLFSALILATGCSSVWSKKYKDDAGVMYGMIYDGNEEGVSGVSVKVNGWLKAVSDGQGRFILKFLYADIKDKKEQRIELEKEGYEKIEDVFYYEPMSLLHIRMESGEDILKEAENLIDEKEYGRAEESIDRAIKIEEYRDEGLFLKAVIKYKEGDKKEAEKLLDLMKLKDNIYVKKLKERLK